MARTNTTDQSILRRQQEFIEQAEKERISDLGQQMSAEWGRRVVYDLIFNRCGLMDLYPAQDSGIYRHEGKRAVGHELAKELQERYPDHYIQMIAERQQANARRAVVATENQSGDDNA